ncbi:unconventional myosin-XV-like isoform X1 [Watersipora subatra]|uniref:unconventional myosin-XV-like isoform X1 n=1 Tax=Watersipora subatra TaxID=2589382 RepID=UPI00355C1182
MRSATQSESQEPRQGGPPRGGWVYGSFNGNADEGMRTLQRKKHVSRTASFGSPMVRRRTNSDTKDLAEFSSQSASGKFSMLEFSMMYYRQNIDRYEALQSGSRGLQDSIKMIEHLKLSSIKKKIFHRDAENNKERRESWSWREQAEAIKWTKVPIENSLLKLPEDRMSQDAVECFKSILMFMGDMEMPEPITELDCVFKILKACHQYPELRDEIYCQLTKQTTNNKSIDSNGCLRGWRLLGLLCCWFSCSDILKPFLLTYLQQNASDPSRAYHSAASTCLLAIRKTLKHGGRRNIPSSEEILAITGGKLSKRQTVLIPGSDAGITVNITPYTLVKETLEEICTKLGVISQAEMEEYAMFALYNTGSSNCVRLKREEYVMDMITQMRLDQVTCSLLFERICWYYQIHYDVITTECTNMMYQQATQLYLDGWLITIPEAGSKIPVRLKEDILQIAALMWRIGENDDSALEVHTCEDFVPDIVLSANILTPDQIFQGMNKSLTHFDQMSSTELDFKIDVLDILRRWPMFGAAFYRVKCESEPKLGGECIIAINRAGIHFLHRKTQRCILSYPFIEIISTRKVFTDTIEGLDVKVGNNRIQKVIRIETHQTYDIIYVIGQYIKAVNTSVKLSV